MPATTPTPYDMPEETQSEMPPTKLEQLMQSMMPTSVPMPAAWEEIVGAGIILILVELIDICFIKSEQKRLCQAPVPFHHLGCDNLPHHIVLPWIIRIGR